MESSFSLGFTPLLAEEGMGPSRATMHLHQECALFPLCRVLPRFRCERSVLQNMMLLYLPVDIKCA